MKPPLIKHRDNDYHSADIDAALARLPRVALAVAATIVIACAIIYIFGL